VYYPDFEQLDKLTEEGYLRKVTSPCGKLFLYNYTDKCTYEKKWSRHTLNARGTVYEVGTNKVIAKAFPKFFNFGELAVSKQRNIMKQTKFEVYEKMDGSLGIVYFYDGKWRVNTRGSFTSDQAVKATEMLSKYDMSIVPTHITLLVEIIYPENRIIVDYGKQEKLVILSGFVNETGQELTEKLIQVCFTGMSYAPKYDLKSIEDVITVQGQLGKMEEGFVVRLKDGERVKFKSAEYLKVARILSNMTPLNFWKAMKDGVVQQEIIEDIPEEFRSECDRIKGELEAVYKFTYNEINREFHHAIQSIGGLFDIEEDRKKLGLFIKEHGSELKHAGAMFPMLLDNGIDKYIMKEIRPKGNEI
jgi:RNA ligase